ncbi:MAG: TonB-dependent receptor [Flavobacteriaceae bacterium]|nr:TonB-dependent receptor [Flavobacteriaceae bacterium]
MKKKTAIILLGLIILQWNHIFSQSIHGKLTDQNKQTIAFANVLLYNGNEEVVNGVASNEEGVFLFENCTSGSYYLEISSLGFKTYTSPTIKITNRDVQLETIVLYEEVNSLEEVIVVQKRPTIKQSAGKLTLDLSQTNSVQSNIQDVVKKLPGVVVSNNGLQYAGQSNLRILINGKTTAYMDIGNLLKDMPADNIAKVELIQQPGAEFEAEGSGPLINIILKKNVRIGTHGSIRAMAGYAEDFTYSTNASISSYKNKLNWQLYGGIRQGSWGEYLRLERKVIDERYVQESNRPQDPFSSNIGTNIDYHLSEQQQLSLETYYYHSDSDRITYNTTSITSGGATNQLFTNNVFDRQRSNYRINPHYVYENDSHKIDLDYQYVYYQDDGDNQLLQQGNSSIAYTDRRYLQDATYAIHSFKGDYTWRLNEQTKIQAGTKYAQVENNSNLKAFAANGNNWELQNAASNTFLIDENILAFYSKANWQNDQWQIEAGLRWEQSQTDGTSQATNETRSRTIPAFFPSFSVNRMLGEHFGLGAAYSYRIERPDYNSLNAFVSYYDSHAYEAGNPNLQAAFTHSYKIHLSYDQQPFFTAGYKATNDAIFQVIEQDDITGEIARTTINLAKNYNWNFRLLAPLNFGENLEGYTGMIAAYNHFEDNSLHIPLQLKKWNYTFFFNIQYQLPWQLEAEADFVYLSGGLDGQMIHDRLSNLDLSISRRFLNKKLNVSLSYEELLQHPFKASIQYDNIDANLYGLNPMKNVYLQVRYSFGDAFQKKKNRKNKNDESDRIQNNN